jgi:hypothetical protein
LFLTKNENPDLTSQGGIAVKIETKKNMQRAFQIILFSFCLVSAGSLSVRPANSQTAEKSPVITDINDPSAGTGANQGTLATAINSKGVIAGNYWDSNSVAHGFVLANGTFTTYDDPDAGTSAGQGTGGFYGINTAGVVAGNYIDSNNAYHGLVIAANGTITNFNVSGAGTGTGEGTTPMAIDSAGDIAGTYIDSNGVWHGFVRSHKKGNPITTFDAPGAGTGSGQGTQSYSINSAGVIAGCYRTDAGEQYGFVRAVDGTITSIGDPSYAGTYAYGINTAGTIVGNVWEGGEGGSGMIDSEGNFSIFTDPGEGTGNGQGTTGFSINSAGDTTGWYIDANNAYHGWVRTSKGVLTSFDVPGDGSGSGQGTIPYAIDNASTVVGYYVDSSSVVHGFSRSN